MKVKDFLRLMIKLFGLFSLITAVFEFLPQTVIMFSGFSNNYFNWSYWIGFTAVGLAMICLFFWLVFRPDFLIDKLKLDKGFDQDSVPVEKLTSAIILKIGCIVVGLFLFLDNLAEFITGCFYLLQESIQTSIEGMFDTNVQSSTKIKLAINFMNLVIGYLLVTTHNSLVRFLLKEGQPNQEEARETP